MINRESYVNAVLLIGRPALVLVNVDSDDCPPHLLDRFYDVTRTASQEFPTNHRIPFC